MTPGSESRTPMESRGHVIFIASLHATRADFELSCEPTLRDALLEARTVTQPFIVIQEFAGPDLASVENHCHGYRAAEIIEAALVDRQARSELSNFLSEAKSAHVGGLSAARRGAPPVLGDHVSVGFETAFFTMDCLDSRRCHIRRY